MKNKCKMTVEKTSNSNIYCQHIKKVHEANRHYKYMYHGFILIFKIQSLVEYFYEQKIIVITVTKILTNYNVRQHEEKKYEENQYIGMIIAYPLNMQDLG